MTPERKQAVGKIVDRAGQLAFWAGLGGIVGYWASDRGIPWLPTFVSAVLALGITSLAAILVGRALMGKTHDPATRRIHYRLLVALALLVLAAGGRLSVFWMSAPAPLTELDRASFHQAFAEDLTHYGEFDQAMAAALTRLTELQALPEENDAVLTAVGERQLLDLWASLYTHAATQDAIRVFYEDWYRFDPSRAERAYHVRSFLLSYGAELSVYERSARFVQAVLPYPSAVKFLDAPHPSHGLPASSFSQLRQQILGSRDQARIVAGGQYLRLLEDGLAVDPDELGVRALWQSVQDNIRRVQELGLVDRTVLLARADVQGLKRTVRRVWFPAQENVASFFGDVRLRRIGWYLITEAQQEAIDLALVPGDILVSRKNWYLSNVGLPGFWPHAILYVGDPTKLAAAFDGDPEVQAWVAARAGRAIPFSTWLAERFPSDWAHYTEGHENHPNRVIEAISEGVVFNSFPHVAGDSLAALRPRLSPLAKAQAITYAFEQLGKPYDFDFDFATDHAIVCSELVWRAYRPSEGKEGFDLALVEIAGRQTLPANEIARAYALAVGTDAQVLDFVLFYDGNERAQVSLEQDEAAFRRSYQRSRWDVMLAEATL